MKMEGLLILIRIIKFKYIKYIKAKIKRETFKNKINNAKNIYIHREK